MSNIKTQTTITGPTWLVGDIHAEQGEFFHNVKEQNIRNSNIILLGDVGVGFELEPPEKFFGYFSKMLKARNNRAYLIRGNHDNPSFWSDETKKHIESKYENVTMLQQGFVNINGDLFYVYPGAVSIDRIIRTEGTWWFRDERVAPIDKMDISYQWTELYEDEYIKQYGELDNNGEEFKPIKGVLGHTGPRPNNLDDGQLQRRCLKDKRLIDDVNEEAQFVYNVMDGVLYVNDMVKQMNQSECNPWYFFGHFHVSYERRHPIFSTKCLNCHELYQIYSWDLNPTSTEGGIFLDKRDFFEYHSHIKHA